MISYSLWLFDINARFSRECVVVEKQSEHYGAHFKSDCEELLGRFQQTDTVRFEEFSAIWREMDFSSVFL